MDDSSSLSLGFENFLLRGSSIRSTDYVVGVVTYAGHDTKIMKNSARSVFKFSRLDKSVNT